MRSHTHRVTFPENMISLSDMIDPNSLLHDGVLSFDHRRSSKNSSSNCHRNSHSSHSIHSSHCSRWAIARVSVLVYESRSSKTFFHSSRSLNSSHWHSSHSFRSVHSSHCHCPRWATAWVSVLETVCVPAYPFCARHFRSFPAFHTFWGSRYSKHQCC